MYGIEFEAFQFGANFENGSVSVFDCGIVDDERGVAEVGIGLDYGCQFSASYVVGVGVVGLYAEVLLVGEGVGGGDGNCVVGGAVAFGSEVAVAHIAGFGERVGV